MIPQAFITEWSHSAPWKTNEQVEQDLVICRAIVEIFSDELLAKSLAFRGGTALHKLYIHPQPRYSEDIDLVQINAEPFGPIIDRIREVLSFLGEPSRRKQNENNNTLVYKFDSEVPPIVTLKLKIETNCREHFTTMGYKQMPFNIKSSYFTGSCIISTYHIEELLGTKLRALYQRRKGRDLFDLFVALKTQTIDHNAVLQCYEEYLNFVVKTLPSQKVFIENMDEKIKHPDFIGDTKGLLRYNATYDYLMAYNLVKNELLSKIKL